MSRLTESNLKRYNKEGFLAPIDAISFEDAETLKAHYYKVKQNSNVDIDSILRSKPHLVFPGSTI